MQILYVGNGNYNHRGARYYDVGRKLLNGLTRNGHNVYFFSDRDTARSATILGSRKLGVRNCARSFIDTCANFAPDFILFGHADIITTESLAKVRSLLPNVKMAQFNVDPIFRPHNTQMLQAKLPYMDATFITTAGEGLRRFYSPNGVACFIPNPVDSSIEWPRGHESSEQPNDVFWAIRAVKGFFPGDARIEVPLFLEKSGKVKVDYHGMNGKALLFGKRYYEQMAQARMGLNISVTGAIGDAPRAMGNELYLYSSDRISQCMGSGLLTLTTRDNRLEELFAEDGELIFFSSKEELLEKIVYFKNHDAERKAVAHAGWKKVHEAFNERLVAKYIIEVTFKLPLTESYAWPTTTY